MRKMYFMGFLLLVMGWISSGEAFAQRSMGNESWRVSQRMMRQDNAVVKTLGQGELTPLFDLTKTISKTKTKKPPFWNPSSKFLSPTQTGASTFKLGAKEYKLPAEIYGLMVYNSASSNY